jgi:hypothetical protein
MPVQLERRGQFVDAFVENFHHAVVAAIDCDLAEPHGAPPFNLHDGVFCNYPGAAHPSETFPHAFDKARLIVAPLILKIIANKIGDGLPVPVVNGVKEIFSVKPDLTLRPPEPDEIQSDANRKGEPPIECSAKRNRHRFDVIFLEESGHLAQQDGLRFFERWFDRFLYRRVSFPAFVLQSNVLDRDRIRIRIGVEIGQDFIF